jgi:hypothetical protein
MDDIDATHVDRLGVRRSRMDGRPGSVTRVVGTLDERRDYGADFGHTSASTAS